MISARPYDDMAAFAVLRDLDAFDQLEAEAVRGARATHLAIFAEWRGMEPHRVASWVVQTAAGTPFAVVALANTGQAGVAGAAMLARDHARYRRELVQLARAIRTRMPSFAAQAGIHRIEARAWADHPRASQFLTMVGFRHEADMPGFGCDGHEMFRQFAWTEGRSGAAQPQERT